MCKDHFAGAEVVEGHVADPRIGHDTGAVHQAAARAVVLAREENVGQLAQRVLSGEQRLEFGLGARVRARVV